MKESFLSIKEIFHIGNGKINVLVFLAVLAVISSFLEIYSIQYMQSLSKVFSTTVSNDLFQIGFICAKFLMLIVLSTIVRNYFCFRVSVFSNDIIKNVRDKAYSKLTDTEYELAIIHDNAFYINLIDNNVNKLSLIFSTSFFTLCSDIFDTVWICFFMIQINITSLLILIVGILPLVLIGNISASEQKKFAENTIKLNEDLIEKINETNDNFSYIKLFKGKEREANRFNRINIDILENDNLSSAALSIFFVIEKSIRYLFVAISLFFLCKDVLAQDGNWMILIPFLLYVQRFYNPFSNLNKYSQLIQKSVSSADKLIDFIISKPTEEISTIQFISDSSESEIVLSGISKNYESETILEDVTFSFKEGINLIDGKSGVGKSTLLKILLGLIKSSSGKVTIYSRADDLNLYAYSGQSNKLFNLSVIENLIYPKTVDHLSSSERMKLESLLDEFGFRKSILNKDIAKEGENLSGGERKRLSILRALIRPSKVVILDEPFANLDSNNIEIIARKIQDLSKNRIVIIVSHETSFPDSLKFNTHLTISGT
ncbi:ABC transporter related [Lancefieldella parvula DSM 20469]|uniref:ABC transporter related n=3 Tax=Lancefieldella parvula TaxID=1382 RepID=C8WA01_LANP1|nr:ABC transporter ATP-binding protein [Lancefieldella parvula]ACV50939.1 ABC transporter related [Lancefieldella parvula DSM 20469]